MPANSSRQTPRALGDARRAGKFEQTDTARTGADVEFAEGAHDALADEGVHEKKLLDKGQIL